MPKKVYVLFNTKSIFYVQILKKCETKPQKDLFSHFFAFCFYTIMCSIEMFCL